MSDSSGAQHARLILVLLGLILLGLGSAVAVGGVHAIRTGAYDLPWRSRTVLDLGPLSMSEQTSGIEHYRGGEAMRMGAGLAAFGAMFAVWGAALLLPQGRPWGRRHRILCLMSLLLLLACAVLIFPLWRIASEPLVLGFYAVCAIAAALAAWIRRSPNTNAGRWVGMGIIGAAILLGRVWPGVFVGAAFAMLASLTAAVHLGLLFPRPISAGS